MSDAARKLVQSCVIIANAPAEKDLLDSSKTTDDLIALLIRAACGPGAGGLGFKVLLTSINSDHGDDRALGLSQAQLDAGVKNHGHTNGFAVDIGGIDGSDIGANDSTLKFCLSMGQHNHYVTKIGLGGQGAKTFLQQLTLACPTTIIFEDNDQPHIHLQTD